MGNKPQTSLSLQSKVLQQAHSLGRHSWELMPPFAELPPYLLPQINKGGMDPVLVGDGGTKWRAISSRIVLVDSAGPQSPGRKVWIRAAAPPWSCQSLLPQPSVSHLLNGCRLISIWSSSAIHEVQNMTNGDKWEESFNADHWQIYQQL